MPREREVEVVARAPRQRLGVAVLEFEGDAQEQLEEVEADPEVVGEGIAVPAAFVLDHPDHGVLGAALDDLEGRVARETMLRHRAFDAVGGLPGELLAVGIVAPHEREEDRVAAAHRADLVEVHRGAFGPEEDLAPARRDVEFPAQEAGAARQAGLVGRRSDLPSFHRHAVLFVALHDAEQTRTAAGGKRGLSRRAWRSGNGRPSTPCRPGSSRARRRP